MLLGSSDGGNELPNGDPTYEYESASNELWMEANLLAYRSNFKIQYNITVLSINIYYLICIDNFKLNYILIYSFKYPQL